MSNAYLYRMPVGIAGAVSRPQDLTIEPVIIDSSRSFPVYGLVGKYDGDYFVPLTAGDTAEKIQGIYVRPYPTTSTPDWVRQIGEGKNFPGDALKRGYMTVSVGGDASKVTKGGTVYVRVASPTDASPLGAFLTAPEMVTPAGDEDPTYNTAILPNAQFTGAGDADGNVEISYKI